ncbi:MAG: hypothetical protein KC619_08690 [Myxococcales bacterium]|nr:hypothetical protein [Myxococcales bacterium]
MELDAFRSQLGEGQGRVATADGEHAFVLGDAAGGSRAELTEGDFAEVAQDVDVTDADAVRVWLRLRVPDDVPPDLAWLASITVDGRVVGQGTARRGSTRDLTDLLGNVSKLVGTHRIAVRLELVRV